MKSILTAVGAMLLLSGGMAAQSPPPKEASDALRISVAECQQELAKKTVIMVDVRGADAFRAGHIAGAVLVSPTADLKSKAEEFKQSGKTVVTYCG